MPEFMTARFTRDFEPGAHEHNWSGADRQPLTLVGGESECRAEVHLLWSDTGLYIRFDCEDARLSCSGLPDFADLYTEDAVELFLQPDSALPLYFEYELSPLGAELPLLVCNNGVSYYGWLPFQYRGARNTRRHTRVLGGGMAPFSACTGWVAEAYIPFALLEGLPCVPPKAGDRWQANFCRIDHDRSGEPARWAWEPAAGTEFHDFGKFGEIVFE
ncbi:MAG: carbohydrate-binding family 9-like protein [Clostridiaceae bacterium]